MKFYLDECVPEVISLELKRFGYDLLTTKDVGQNNRKVPDPYVLKYAIRTERTVITYNRKDFIKLHNENSNHFGIIVCHEDYNFGRLAARIYQRTQEFPDHASMYKQLIQIPKLVKI